MKPIELKEQIKKLPPKPGIYLFKNAENKPLYIGKALNLKKRVSHYQKTDDPRLQKMIVESRKIDFMETKNDIEALILESQYIKKHQPDFNIMLRDDKQYFFVEFTRDNFPKISLTHQPTSTSAIGPFTDGSALKTTLRLMRKIFPYCTCKQPHNNYCLNYHIGKCPGFCCLKKQTTDDLQQTTYNRNIKAIKDILTGKKESLIRQFEKEMKVLSGKQEYEKALELQYKIEKLKRVFENALIIQYQSNNLNIPKELKDILKLPKPPNRIECYDIANIQGKHAVGAMVVFSLRQDSGQAGWQPNKNEYRKFKIYTKSSPDDSAMLKEILTRRFNHPEWLSPDLIVVDGGKPQLNMAKKVVKNIAVIALTKNEKHIGHKVILENGKEISLSKLPANIKNLLLQIDSEAHRFAISFYRKTHRKSLS